MVAMNIIKYKKSSNGKYKVELDDGSSLLLYEDVILKYQLLITKSIDSSNIDDINNDNMQADVYYVALNSLKSRMKSINDLRVFLLNKEYPSDMVDNAINKLIDQGYLNDENYVRCYINNQMITTSNGPDKIKKELLDKKIDINIIDDNLDVFNEEEQILRINKIINKRIKSNNSRGGFALKNKIYNDLKILGYNNELINITLNDYSFDNNNELAKKEYDKLIRKYSRKYSGNELKRFVKEKLYMKGLKYEEID